MQHGRGWVWARRAKTVTIVVLIAAGGFVIVNWSSLGAKFAGHRFRSASTDEARAAAAAKLVGMGDRGLLYLVDTFRSGSAPECVAASTALRDSFAATSPTDPAYAARSQRLADGFAVFSDDGKAAVLDLVPELLACPDTAPACRMIVLTGLTLPSADAKVQAIRMALRPEVSAKEAVVPLLNDEEAEVRRAAMLAVGPVFGDAAPVVADENLFRGLHDPDVEVRDLCEAALKSRGLDVAQVAMARRLTHPNPTERLRLLTDLRSTTDAVRNPGPWLERLARDPDPAVRLGAARAAHESRLQFARWLDTLADSDPDPTVRRWAGYYRGLSVAPVQATRFTDDR